MKQLLSLTALALAACAAPSSSTPPQNAAPAKAASVAQAVGAAEARPGLFDLWVDGVKGKVWMALPQTAGDPLLAECLWLVGLRQGLGSNPVGLDRGQLGDAVLVRFVRRAGQVFLERPNLGFRATDAGDDETRATAESFASAVLWSAPIAAEEPGRVLIELTPLLLQDRHGIGATLARTGQGAGWKVDAKRSALVAEEVLAFPDNLELEALLTLTGGKPAREVRSVAPDPSAVSLVQHQSFVRLPDDGYRPRRHDPRMGALSIGWQDYATDLAAPVRERRVARHRLDGEPLVYYVDRGAPEPIRSALLDGARWWAEAFEAAGHPGVYRVELLPEGAHPLDVRYNVIQWVHRSTRGWSYGNSITDPRTGEILKGHVSLGSLRVRQDRLLFEGLLGSAESGTGAERDPVQLALARIRQLSAHEVGHTLGLSHNFAASTYGGRASVMDYPAPLVGLDAAGELDLSRLYGVGLGAWDVHAIRMLYQEPGPRQSEAEVLAPLLARVGRHDLRFATDADARPAGGAHPYAGLWDNGSDAPAALEELLAVRAKALRGFGLERLPAGWPVGSLQEVFAPLYLLHRYQVEAAAKWIGGVDYDPAARDSRDPAQRIVPAADQRRALAAVLRTLEPEVLDIDEGTLALLLPAAPSGLGNGERLAGRTGAVLDPLEAAATAVDHTLAYLLHPERAARLVDQARRDPQQLGLDELLESLLSSLAGAPEENARLGALRQVAREQVARVLMELAAHPSAPGRVRGPAERALAVLAAQQPPSDAGNALRRSVQRFLERPAQPAQPAPEASEAPPGSPIGQGLQHPNPGAPRSALPAGLECCASSSPREAHSL